MSEYVCIIMVTSLIIGFILGRWREKNYCGDIIISKDSCTFALDISKEDIPLYQELVFRVVNEEDG